MKLYAEVDDKDRKLKTLYGIVEYMDGTRLVCDKFYAVKEQEPKPKTIQEIQAESEKYQKAFEDGYEQGYAQAKFDYEQEPCEDCISRQAVLDMATTIQTDDFSGNEIIEVVDVDDVKALPPVTPQQKTGYWIEHPHECGENWEYSKYECSECSEWEDNDSEYCPNCGAKMESEVGNDT